MQAQSQNFVTGFDFMTATPSRLVHLLLDGAVESMKMAVDSIGRGDIESRSNAVCLAGEIVGQLYLALNMERGGEIAEQLARIYNSILCRLPSLNLYDDAELAREIIDLLEPLRDAWQELDSDLFPNAPATLALFSVPSHGDVVVAASA